MREKSWICEGAGGGIGTEDWSLGGIERVYLLRGFDLLFRRHNIWKEAFIDFTDDRRSPHDNFAAYDLQRAIQTI
jgi:hypothetical protein